MDRASASEAEGRKFESYADHQLLPTPPFAIRVLADALAISPEEAMKGLKGLARNGWFVAPAEPTNAMLAAYADTFRPPRKAGTMAASFTKARKRWRAMGIAGTKAAFSMLSGERSEELHD